MKTPAFLIATAALLSFNASAIAQISKGHQILIDRGLQLQGIVTKDDVFNLNTYSNAHYTSIVWLWESNPAQHGAAPGFPWGRWVGNESQMPPVGSETPFLSQLVSLQLGDEQFLADDNVRDQLVNWFNNVQGNWPNTILYVNNYAGQAPDAPLADFISRAQPDMLCFDNYPFEEDQNTGAPYALWTTWFSELRRYREHARLNNIPLATYRQTFHADERPTRVYRDPSRSELRYNTFAALAFSAKSLIDFTYNTGASSLFTTPGGDSNPTILYSEMADANSRARNFGKTLVRLKPIDDAVPNSYTTGLMFIRGRNSVGAPHPVPIGFLADPQDPDNYTDWAFGRNDPFLTGWSVTNVGTKNNGYPGEVILSWFRPLDESFDGPEYTNQIYLMVVNGLTDPTGTPAECAQEIQLNFTQYLLAVEMLNPLTGTAQAQALPFTNGMRRLTLNLNGGDAVLFKFATGAPFVGADVVGPPVIGTEPVSCTNVIGSDATFTVNASGAAPLGYQWRVNGANINGATANAMTHTNVQPADDLKNFTVVITNASGSVTSSPATLTVVAALPSFFYEPFDYVNVGQSVSSNTPANWTFGGSGANDLNVASGNLTYPGLLASTGNSVTNGGAGLAVRRLFGSNVNSGLLYFSALFRINQLGFGTGGWNGASSQVAALTASDNTGFRLSVMVRSNSPSSYVFGLLTPSVTATFDTTGRSANETIFLVGRYDFTQTPNTVSLWINPDAAHFGAGEPLPTLSLNTASDGIVINRFNMRQNVATGASSVPAAMQWDELRVGRTWVEVTPPHISLSTGAVSGNGNFQFIYSNATGRSGSIYTSSNLIDWVSNSLAPQIAPGVYQFIDTNAPVHRQRFYQLRKP